MSNSVYLFIFFVLLFLNSCTSLPITKHKDYKFPEERAFLNTPDRKFKKIGPVRSKVNFSILDPEFNTDRLCRNYFNKSVEELVKFSRGAGGDAVIEVESVVFYRDGKMEAFKTAECSEDEEEGQILTRGIAVQWIKEKN